MVIRHPVHSFVLTQGSTRIKVLGQQLPRVRDRSNSVIACLLLSESRNTMMKMREAVILMERPAYLEQQTMAVSPPSNNQLNGIRYIDTIC